MACRKMNQTKEEYQAHLETSKHKTKQKRYDDKRCEICDESFSSKKVRDSHILSSRHRNRIELGDGVCCGRRFNDVYRLRLHRKTAFHQRNKDGLKTKAVKWANYHRENTEYWTQKQD